VTEQGPPKGPKQQQEVEAINAIFQLLQDLEEDSQQRVLQTVVTYYQSTAPTYPKTSLPTTASPRAALFSEDRSISPKNFIVQKQPTTDVERVACLGYYLTHYRDTPHFKTLDISTLNTEAAQPKFANATVSMDNAMKMGYLVPATKGNKQLSAAGEVFVQKLPDREAARAAMFAVKPRRKSRKGGQRGELSPFEHDGGSQS
jgi:hypothetical protein